MRPRVPGSRVRFGAALPPLMALLLSCGSSTHMVADGGGPEAGQGPALSVTTTSLPGGMVDVKYHAALAAKGGWRPLTWTISTGSLPGGLALNPATGNIDGVPSASGQFQVTVLATDAGIPQQTAEAPLTLTIQPRPGPVSITTTSLPNAQVGVNYSQELQATGGATPYAWTIDSGGLPSGLRLNFTQSGNTFTWTINGVATKAGPWSFVVRVNDSLTTSQTATQPLTLTVDPPPPLSVATASPMPNAELGNGYWEALEAAGGLPPYGWQLVSGTLPPGLNFPLMATDGGVYPIRGTPTALGTSTFTVKVVDSYQPVDQAQKQLSITVVQPPQQDAGVQDDAAQSDAAQNDAAQNDAAQSDAAQSDVNQTDVQQDAAQDDAAQEDGPTDV
jgi:hypothetical protein